MSEDIMERIQALDKDRLKAILDEAEKAPLETAEQRTTTTSSGATATTVTSTKPGYKTTEGWLTGLMVVIGAAIMAWGQSRGNELLVAIGAALSGTTTIGYQVSRGSAKRS